MRTHLPLLFGASLTFFACGGTDATNDPIDPGIEGSEDPNIVDPNDPIDPIDPEVKPVDMPPLAEGVSTLAGYSSPGDSDGPRGVGFFSNPVNVVYAADRVFVADFYNGRIASISADGAVKTEVRQDGFSRPFGMLALDANTMIIQTDRTPAGDQDGALWRFDVAAGSATMISEHIGRPRSMVAMPGGEIVVADYQKHFIGTLNPNTGVITTLAGAPGEEGYADGAGGAARFHEPLDMVVLSDTEVLVADRYNNAIRKVSLSGEVTTWAGSTEAGHTDGALAEARFAEPLSMAKGADGTIYIADGLNYRIRMIGSDGMVATMAGNGQSGYRDDSEPMNAQFTGMEGIDISADGRYLFVADGARGLDAPFNRVRRITLP